MQMDSIKVLTIGMIKYNLTRNLMTKLFEFIVYLIVYNSLDYLKKKE